MKNTLKRLKSKNLQKGEKRPIRIVFERLPISPLLSYWDEALFGENYPKKSYKV
jgi:hypothetical protein